MVRDSKSIGVTRRDLFSSLAGLVGVFRLSLDTQKLSDGVHYVETTEASSDPLQHIVVIRVKGRATPEHMITLCQTWKRVVKDSPWRHAPTVVCDDKVSVEFHNGELVRTTHLVSLPNPVAAKAARLPLDA